MFSIEYIDEGDLNHTDGLINQPHMDKPTHASHLSIVDCPSIMALCFDIEVGFQKILYD